MGWFKTKVAPWFESKEQREKREEKEYNTYMREHGMVPITVPYGQFSETRVKWVTREEAARIKGKEGAQLAASIARSKADKQRWLQNLAEQPAREKAAKEKEKRDRIAACRALVAEANASEAQAAEAQAAEANAEANAAEANAAEAQSLDVRGGYRRRRMTKRKRQNKTKRSRK